VIERAVALATGDTVEDISFPPSPAAPAASVAHGTPMITIPIGTTVDDATRQLVRATIAQCGGNKLKAAKTLGIPPRTMYRHFSTPES